MSTDSTYWPDLGPFWTLANSLSLMRLVLVVPITVLIWQDGSVEWLFGLMVVAILTDWFDGRVARWTRTVSDWGKVIDPVADKFAAVMTVSALTFRAGEPTLPLWFFGLVMGRDVLILAGSALIARRSGRIVMSAWAGKAATSWLALTVLAAILKADAPVLTVCIGMAAGLLVFSFVVYGIRYLNAVRRPPPKAGEALPGPALEADAPAAEPKAPKAVHGDGDAVELPQEPSESPAASESPASDRSHRRTSDPDAADSPTEPSR